MLTTDVLLEATTSYRREGAAVLRNVVTAEWIDRLRTATDQILTENAGTDLNQPGDGRFFAGMFSWLSNREIAAFIRESGLAKLAGSIMGSQRVHFFYDQLLVKEPGAAKRTPWHQDLPYWPVSGDQILSIWVPMDTADDTNGVVTYVKGSHQWGAFFPAPAWSEEKRKSAASADPLDIKDYRDAPNGTTIEEIELHPERFDFLSWKVEPGDAIIHHPLVVHGAPGNCSASRRRRALATRWFGDDVRWNENHSHFMRRLKNNENGFPYPTLSTGDEINDPLFPVVWEQ